MRPIGALVALLGPALVGVNIAGSATAAEAPVFIGESNVTVVSGEQSEPFRLVAAGATTLRLEGLSGDVRCGTDVATVVTCTPTRGVVSVTVKVRTASGSGSLVAIDDDTGRSATVALTVAADAEPAAPSAVTLRTTTCWSWLGRSVLLGCDDLDATPLRFDPAVQPPGGDTILSGDAGTAVLSVTDDDGDVSTPRTATISSLESFGDAKGKLGTGETAMEITVTQRAPIRVGFAAVLLGALLAALFTWATGWAQATTASETARITYDKTRSALRDRRSKMAASVERYDGFAACWSLGASEHPPPLTKGEDTVPAKVDAYVAEAAAVEREWTLLEELLPAYKTIEKISRDSKLAKWCLDEMTAATHPDHRERDLILKAAAVLEDATTPPIKRFEVLNAGTDPALARALNRAHVATVATPSVGGSKVLSRFRSALRSLQAWTSGDSGEPEPTPHASQTGRRVPRQAQLSPEPSNAPAMLKRNEVLVAGLATITLLLATGAVLEELWLEAADVVVGATLLGLTFAGYVALRRAARLRTWRLLVAGALGWILAGVFGGADALDASKGWGDGGDVLKTVAASFTVAGTAQVLRLGLPKKANAD